MWKFFKIITECFCNEILCCLDLGQITILILLHYISHAHADADCVEEIDAQRVLGYALFKDGKVTRLSYPLENFHSDVAGRSFHNGRFIQRMREKAAKIPKYSFFPWPIYIVLMLCFTQYFMIFLLFFFFLGIFTQCKARARNSDIPSWRKWDY